MPGNAAEPLDVVDTDVLVVGGGGAGLRAAIAAHDAGASVRVVVKSALGEGGSTADGASEIMGFAAAVGAADPRDSPEWHYKDTIAGGVGLVDPTLVAVLAEEAPQRLLELIDWGVPFERDTAGRLVQTLSDFATFPRVCRVPGGRTGSAILTCLIREIKRRQIVVDEHVMVARILTASDQVAGALGVHVPSGRPVGYRCRAIVLAAGGVGAAFLHSVGGPLMTGDAYAMAYEVGAQLVNMEITQVTPGVIHPTWAFLSRPVYLLEPRVRNGLGEEFLPRYLPPGITVKDVLVHKAAPYTTANPSRYLDEAIEEEIRTGNTGPHGGVYYDLSHVPEDVLESKIPNTVAHLRRLGVDLASHPLEVGILFHLINGGVRMTDATAATSFPGLFVAGEAAGGVRGPNRPGGNSLAEGQVFGRRAGESAARFSDRRGPRLAPDAFTRAWRELISGHPRGERELTELRLELQRVMSESCLVAKSGPRLENAIRRIHLLRDEAARATAAEPNLRAFAIGTRHAITVALLMATSMLAREETRGAHYRTDFPCEDNQRWRRSISVQRGPYGPLVGTLAYPTT